MVIRFIRATVSQRRLNGLASAPPMGLQQHSIPIELLHDGY
jgi:hypothetical protein